MLAPAGSFHTRKSIDALHHRGHELLLITAHDPGETTEPSAWQDCPSSHRSDSVPTDDARAAAAAVLRIINDPALKKSLGEKGRKWVVDTYDWEGSVGRLESLYRDVIGGWRQEPERSSR